MVAFSSGLSPKRDKKEGTIPDRGCGQKSAAGAEKSDKKTFCIQKTGDVRRRGR